MNLLWILFAFGFGFAARQIGLPPLVGFLAAGFALNALGVEGGTGLKVLEEIGVTLLLFTIGLKLRIGNLLRPEVWGGATVHLGLSIALFGLGAAALAAGGFSIFAALDGGEVLLLAFALTFSSTVFAVKVLEDKGDASCLYGRTAIGVLIMQDVFAVLFLAFSAGKVPSPWALLLFGLLLLRPMLGAILERTGHGEMLLLAGTLLALLLGDGLFDLFGVKGDLGALIVGMLMAPHPKSGELYTALMSFKDLFLVAFFLNIGISAAPYGELVLVAALLSLAVPLKVLLYLLVFTRFRLSARSALLASFSLANYSEFGLIVATVGVKAGLLDSEWPLCLALAVSFTFAMASPLCFRATSVYRRVADVVRRLETRSRHPEEQPIDFEGADVVVVGMGRVGVGAYDSIEAEQPGRVLGMDRDPDVVEANVARGRNVILADVMDDSFWERQAGDRNPGLVLLTTDRHVANMRVAEHAQSLESPYHLAATARFDDDAHDLREAGVDLVFNFFADAGMGFADRVKELLEGQRAESTSSE